MNSVPFDSTFKLQKVEQSENWPCDINTNRQSCSTCLYPELVVKCVLQLFSMLVGVGTFICHNPCREPYQHHWKKEGMASQQLGTPHIYQPLSWGMRRGRGEGEKGEEGRKGGGGKRRKIRLGLKRGERRRGEKVNGKGDDPASHMP